MADLIASIGLDPRDAKRNLAALASDIDGLADNVETVADAFDDVAAAAKGANTETKKTDRSIGEIKDAMAKLVREGKAASAEFADMRDELRRSTIEAKKAADAMAEVEAIAGSINSELADPPSFFEKLKGGADAAGGGVTGLIGSFAGFAGATVAVEAVGQVFSAVSDAIGGAIEKGREFEQMSRTIAARTGATGDKLRELEGAAKDAFVAGVGESIGDATKAITEAQARLGDLFDTAELTQFTKDAAALGRTFDMDVSEVITKAAPFVKQFGLDGKEAFDLLAVSIRDGGTAANDVVDTLSEYSQQAKTAGYNAAQFADILTRGAKEGIFNTDKLGDAIKETGIRLKAGDIDAALGSITSPITATIQGIVDAGKAGTKSVQQVIQESNAEIERAFAAGEISGQVRQQLQVGISGTPVEEIGSELFGKIFGAPIDEKTIEARAKQAGELIRKNTGQVVSWDQLGREFDVFVGSIGAGIISIFNETIAPIIGVLKDAFGRISEAVSSAFSGDGTSGIMSFLGTLRDVFVDFIALAIEPTVQAWRLLAGVVGAVIDGIVDAFEPLTTAFDEVFGGVGEGVDVFGVFRDVLSTVVDVLVALVSKGIKIVLAPTKLMMQLIAGTVDVARSLVSWIGDLVSSFVDWFAAIEPVRVAIDAVSGALSAVGDVAGDAIDAVAGWLGLGSEPENDLAAATKRAADEMAKAKKEADEAAANTKKIQAAAVAAVTDVQSLATAFSNASAAADTTVSNYTNAIAQAQIELEKALKGQSVLSVEAARANLKKLEEEQVAARKRQRDLARRADNADDVGNVERQKARKASRDQQTLDDAKADELRTANRIANVREREAEVLRIEQDYAVRAIDLQIATAATATREDRVALDNLKKQRATLLEDNAAAVVALRAKFAAEDLARTIEAENARTTAIVAAEQRRADQIAQVRTTFGSTRELIEEEGRLRVSLLERQAAADARAYIEGLAEFRSARAVIDAKVEVGDIDATEAKRQIDALYSTIDTNLREAARAGGDVVSDAYRAIFDQLGVAVRDAKRVVTDELELFDIKADTNLVRREFRLILAEARTAYRERLRDVRGNIEAERRVTLDWYNERQQVELDYLARTSKVYAAAVDFRAAIEEAFSKSFSDAADQTIAEAESKFAAFIGGLRDQLKSGEIGWAEYAAAAQQAAEDMEASIPSTFDRIASAFVDAFNVTAAGTFDRFEQEARAKADTLFATYRSNNERIADLDRMATETAIEEIRLRSEGQTAEADAALERYNDILGEQSGLVADNTNVLKSAFESVGAASAAAFGEMIVSGENAFKALVLVALDALQALVPILVAQIFGVQVASPNPANALSFGSAGTIAAAALTAVLQGLVSAAKSAVKLEHGVVDLPRGGHPAGIDTVPAWLTEGESVVTVKGTKGRGRFMSNAEVLRKIQGGRAIDDVVLDHILRDNLRRGLLLDRIGVTLPDESILAGAIAARGVMSSVVNADLAAKLDAVSNELAQIRKHLRTDAVIDLDVRIDRDRLIEEVTTSERSRVRHLG